ncbi:MAG TPA: TRAP transporter substrate-binding protein [Eubacteriales bacterium]|nr:TRAP transporter substrate-binding protein [Eubacteriales bacterium]
MKIFKVMALMLALVMALGTVACAQSTPAAETETDATTETAVAEATEAPAEEVAEEPQEVIEFSLGWAETAERSGHALSEAAYTFAEQVEALSGGQLVVNLYPAAQLGDAASMLTQVEAGTLECCMSVSNGQFATSYYPDLGFLDIPYLFEDSQEAYDLLAPDTDFFQSLQSDIAEKTGIRPLVFFNEGLRHITNSKHEIKTPEDVAGLKIRTMSVAAHMKMFEALGASPTNISWGELYTALQTGVVDAQENPIANCVYISAWEVQKYITLDGHVCLCGLFCMNDDFYQSLSAEMQAVVDEAANAALDAEYSMFLTNEAANLQILKDNGMIVTELTAEEKDAFRQACQPQVIEYLRTVMDTPELIDQVLEIVGQN